MGNKQSSTIKSTVDVINESMVNSFSKTSNAASGQIDNNQSFTLDIAGKLNCAPGSLDITQTNQTTLNLAAQFKTSNSQQIMQQIQGAIEAAATSNNKAVSGFMGTKIADSQESQATIEQHLKNIVKTNIENIVNNSCIATVSNIQNGVVRVPASGEIISNGCHFGQNVQGFLNVNCITNTIEDVIAKDAVLSKNMTAVATTQDSLATGPIQETFTGLSAFVGAWLFPIIVIAIVIGIAIIAEAYYKSRSKSKTAKEGEEDLSASLSEAGKLIPDYSPPQNRSPASSLFATPVPPPSAAALQTYGD